MTTEAPGTTVGSPVAPQPGGAAPAAAAPAPQAGAAIGTDSGTQGASAAAAAAVAAGVDLKALYAQFPGLKEQIDKEVVSPAIKGWRDRELGTLTQQAETRATQQLAERQNAQRVAALAQQAQNADETIRNRALTELGKMNVETFQSQQRATAQQTERLAETRALTVEFMSKVMQVDVTELPPEVTNVNLSEEDRVAALREYILDQSPAVQKKIGNFQRQAGVDDAALSSARAAAEFAGKLATTPSPANVSGTGSVTSDATSPLGNAEWETNRHNFEWRQANEKRITKMLWPGQT